MLAGRMCLRTLPRANLVSLLSTVGLRSASPVLWQARRAFANTSRLKKDDAKAQTLHRAQLAKHPAEESVKPETVKAEKPAEVEIPNTALLAEETKSTGAQRKADWGIIKDMAQYLWPKDDLGVRFRVGLSVVLLVGAKVSYIVAGQRQRFGMLIDTCRSSTCKFLSTSRPSSTR